MFRWALDLKERALGPENSSTINTINNLGVLLYSKGEYDEALSYVHRALEIRDHALGPEHLDTVRSRENVDYPLNVEGK